MEPDPRVFERVIRIDEADLLSVLVQRHSPPTLSLSNVSAVPAPSFRFFVADEQWNRFLLFLCVLTSVSLLPIHSVRFSSQRFMNFSTFMFPLL